MNKTQTLIAINKAIEFLLIEDMLLLENNISERAITHKLAEHLSKQFAGLNVDCEYNRHIIAMKSLVISLKEMEKLFKKKIAEDDTYSVFPDIIIHKRMTDEQNLVVIEVKKVSSYNGDKEFDLLKLKKFTSEQFQYKLGVYIEFETKNGKNYFMKFFQKGKEIKIDDLADF